MAQDMPPNDPAGPDDHPMHARQHAAGTAQANVAPPWRLPQVRVHPMTRLFLWAVALVLTLYFLETVSFVALLVLGAAALAALLAPVRRWLPGPRWVSGALVGVGFFLLVLGGVAVLVYLLKGPMQHQLQQWPQIRQELSGIIQSVTATIGLGTDLTFTDIQNQLWGWITGGRGADIISTIVGSLGAILVGLALLAFGCIYFLADNADHLQQGIERLLPGRQDAIRGTVHSLEVRFRWWLMGTFISMLIIGGLLGLGFGLIGLRFALPLAVLGGMAEIVPTFGPILVFLLSLLVGATQGTTQLLGVTVVYLCIQMIESYVLLPVVMREAVRLPPLVTLFSVVLWSRLFGFLGLLLALPLNLLIWTVIQQFYLRDQASR